MPPEPRSERRSRAPGDPPIPLATTLLKALFFAEALALAATTLLGATIGITHAKRKRRFAVVLASGTIVPIALILL